MRLLELDLDTVAEACGDVPPPGTLFTFDDVQYECVMVSPVAVYAIPRP